MLKKFTFFALLIVISSVQLFAQPERWQQQINYKIDASLDVQKNTVKGTEEILYTNNLQTLYAKYTSICTGMLSSLILIWI